MEDVEGCGAKMLRRLQAEWSWPCSWVERVPKRRLGLDDGGTLLERYFPEMEGSHQDNEKGCTGVVMLQSQQELGFVTFPQN